MSTLRLSSCLSLFVAFGLLPACSSSSDSGSANSSDSAGGGSAGDSSLGGSSAVGGAANGGSSAAGSSSHGGSTAAGGASQGGSSAVGGISVGGASAGGVAAGGSPAGGSPQAGSPGVGGMGAGGDGGDPFAAARVACMDEINKLRATKNLTPYSRWQSAEMCVDQEVTSDETTGSPHAAWIGGTYTCNGNGQNECEGQGADGIAGCLDSMWAEKDQAACSGCDACADAYDPSCPNCDFYGMTTGQVCGHYVNLSAKYFSGAACGFSSLGGWDAINFM